MSDDVVERVVIAIREHVEPSHPDTIDTIIGVDDAAKAALAALRPGDKVGDGCVVVDKAALFKFVEAGWRYSGEGWNAEYPFNWFATADQQKDLSDDLLGIVLEQLAALDTGESE